MNNNKNQLFFNKIIKFLIKLFKFSKLTLVKPICQNLWKRIIRDNLFIGWCVLCIYDRCQSTQHMRSLRRELLLVKMSLRFQSEWQNWRLFICMQILLLVANHLDNYLLHCACFHVLKNVLCLRLNHILWHLVVFTFSDIDNEWKCSFYYQENLVVKKKKISKLDNFVKLWNPFQFIGSYFEKKTKKLISFNLLVISVFSFVFIISWITGCKMRSVIFNQL